jgi:hypothetical protein
MRKVFALFAGLVLLSMLTACSDDSTPTSPAPSTEFEITTDSVPVGYTCSPYTCQIEIKGGTAPYTWTLAEGSDALPDGLVLTSSGKITGLMSAAGDFSFTVRATDSSPTPKTIDKTFDMSIDVPANPSLAVFFDGNASICEAATRALVQLKCYVFIMLEGGDTECSRAVEFKLCLTDADGVALEAGSQFDYISVETPSYVAVQLGDLFEGWAGGFNMPKLGPQPILVASFNLLLIEDLENLTFKFEANPDGSLGIASCEKGYPKVEVTGREAAVNFEVSE